MLPFTSQQNKQQAYIQVKSTFDPKFISLLETILIEFRQLLQDSHSPLVLKKKLPEIKIVRQKMDAVVLWIEGVKVGAANFKSQHPDDQKLDQTQQKGEIVDENLTILIDALACIVEQNKLHKQYMQILNIIQRIVMTLPVRNKDDKSQIETNIFRISQECRERTLLICSEMASQDNFFRSQNQANQQQAPLDEMTQLKMLQIIMIFLDSNHSDKLSKKFVNLVLKTCFQLFEQKQLKNNSSNIGIAVKSTIQATLKQLFSLIFDNFIKQIEQIVGTQNSLLAMQQDQGQFSQIAQIFLQKYEEINKSLIFQIVEDNLQNLATALFINEQYTFSQNVGVAFLSLKTFTKNQQQHENKLGGSISNQHVWNFKPSVQAFCAVLEIIVVYLEQTKSLSIYIPKLCDIFKNQICPTLSRIQKYFSVNDYIGGNLGIRIVKCLVTIVQSFMGKSQNEIVYIQAQNKSSDKLVQENINDEKNQICIQSFDFKNIEEIIFLISQMADFNQVVSCIKEKEVNQNNIFSIFQKMNWRQMAGIEAIAVLLSNQYLAEQLFFKENLGVATTFLLEVLKNNLQLISLADQKNVFQMINSQQDTFITLNSFQQSQNNSQKQEIIYQDIGDQKSLLNLIKCSKNLIDLKSQQLQIQDDEFNISQIQQNQLMFKNFLSPFQFQQLLLESVFTLIDSLKMIEQQDFQDSKILSKIQDQNQISTKNQPEKLIQLAHQPKYFTNQDRKKSPNEKQKLQGNSSKPLNIGKEETLVQANLMNNSQNQLQRQNSKNYKINNLNQKQVALSRFSIYLNDLLQKIHISIQRNQNHLQTQNIKFTNEFVIKELGKLSTNQQTFINKNKNFLNQILMLQSSEQLIEILQSEKLVQQRDMVIGILCQQCYSQEISQSTKAGQGETLQSVFTLSNYASFLSLEKIIEFFFQYELKKAGQDDIIMWSLIIETLVRVDSLISNFQEDQLNTQNKNLHENKDPKNDANQKNRILQSSYSKKVWVVDSQKEKCYIDVTQIQNENNLQRIVSQYLLSKEEIEKLRLDINFIYEQSSLSNQNSFTQFIGSFQYLIKEFLASISSRNAYFTNSDLKPNSYFILLIKRLNQILQANFSRIDSVWDFYLNVIESIVQNQIDRSNFIKNFVIDSIEALILAFFQFKKNQKELLYSVKEFESEILEKNVKLQQVQDLSPDFQELGYIDQKKEQKNDSDMSQSENESIQILGDKQEDLKWIGYNWQSTIFQIFSNIMVQNNLNDKLYVLKSIDKIIQQCGQQLQNEGWRVIIMNVGNGSGDMELPQSSQDFKFLKSQIRKIDPLEIKNQSPDNQKLYQLVYQYGFKCLKFIINNYIDNIGQENLILILDCIQRYVQSPNSENINSKLIAIGMFMNFADYIARISNSQIQELNEKIECKKSNNVEEIWENIFTRILVISQDKRCEIRRSSIQILENIIINHGQKMSMQTWNLLMQNTLVEMLKNSSKYFHITSSIHFNQPSNQRNSTFQENQKQIETPTSKQQFTQRKKMDFDDESVMKALIDNDDNSWSETCTQLISFIYRAMKIFLLVISKQTNQDLESNIADQIWKQFNHILSNLVLLQDDINSEEANKTICSILIQIFSSQDDFLALQTTQDERNYCTLFILSKFKYQQKLFENIIAWVARQNTFFKKEIIQAQQTKNVTLNKTKSLVLKLIPVLVQSLTTFVKKNQKELLNEQNRQKYSNFQDQFINSNSIKMIIELLDNFFICCEIIAEGFKQYQNEDPQNKCFKLSIEEHQIFNFFENFIHLISDYEKSLCHPENIEAHKNAKSCQETLLNYFISRMNYKGTAHSESILKLFIETVSTMIVKSQISTESLMRNLVSKQNSYLVKLQKLINMRYNWQLSRNIVLQYRPQNPQIFSIHQILSQLQNLTFKESNFNVNSMSINIIHFSLLHLLLISKYVLKPLLIKSIDLNLKISQNLHLYSMNWILSNENEVCAQDSEIDEKFQVQILGMLIQIVRNELMFDLQKFDFEEQVKQNFEQKNELNQKDESLFIELINICQVIDMISISFITNDIIPIYAEINQHNQESEQEKVIINIVDNGCNVEKGGFGNSQEASNFSLVKFLKASNVLQSKQFIQAQSQISQFSIQNLFQICKLPEILANDNQQNLTLNLKKLGLPFIICRCQEILKRFCQDEQRSGSIKLQQSRVQEVVFILKELQNIQNICQPKSDQKNGIDQNLISILMPILSEMIVSQSDEIRQNLKIIFSNKNQN